MKIDIQLYRGYMNNQELVVYGHVFKSWSPKNFKVDRRGVKHAFSILRMYTIKPLANADIYLEFKNMKVHTKTLHDGYFRFNIPFNQPLKSGWHSYNIVCKTESFGITSSGELLKPFESKYAIISDIDDTFLISHSSNFFKKLYVLLTKNIYKRKVFEDVAEHYQALSAFGQEKDVSFNSFFYVSSSEWNLYSFINSLSVLHRLPKAVLKLKKIKTGLTDFLLTGRGKHDHKFNKIKDIISFYPNLEYILFGDDTQRDPFIYERVCKVFPMSVKVVYIRQTRKQKKKDVIQVLNIIETLNVKTLYYKNSSEAIAHSKSIGVI